ncbi:MAG: hypothetical protein H6711_24890, partial [Myxococcales bacterium]|nr:hypothetical protein [Myxococcales bacterium]
DKLGENERESEDVAALPVDSAFLVLTPADLDHATRDDLLGALAMISDFANELGERHQGALARIDNLDREIFTLRAVLDQHRRGTPA